MISSAKVQANLKNAQASTGPRTVLGRLRSAKNARTHGLSMPIYKDLDVSQEINAVAQRIVGPDASAIEQGLGYRIAEAQITIRRVRAARNKLLADAINQPYYESRAATRAKAKVLLALLQHDASGWPAPQIEAYLLATPQGTEKFALILCQEFK